ncbi:MAG: 3-deoxy-D-manno-octulosonic-acid transferase [Chlamydiia bacterium]|nr:3-deoxy-D-manno-octulosonic-acid transferase [Chlamydiia bacterium]
MLFSVLYEIFFILVFLFFLPKTIYQAIFKKKYRQSFFKRLGFQFPKVSRKGEGPIIWVHAVSVGEAQAIASFVERLKKEINDATIVISSASETGHEAAKRILPFADYHVYLPFDFWLSVNYVFKQCSPDIVILSETDFWWRFLQMAKKEGAVTLLASGKISEASYTVFKRFRFFSRKLFSLLDFLCVQSEVYKEKFIDLGVSSAKILVTGNIKGDTHFQSLTSEEKAHLRQKFGFADDDFILVVGSSHDPEERLIINQLSALFETIPKLKLMLVPRHPERFSEVKALVAELGYPYTCWSSSSFDNSPRSVVVDTMGVLIKCYQIADLAIVAGSFTDRVGGHNILEPCYFGIPTLCGPFMYKQKSLLDFAIEGKAVVQTDIKDLQVIVKELIESKEKRQTLSRNGLSLLTTIRGSVDKTVAVVQELTPQYFSLHIKSCVK